MHFYLEKNSDNVDLVYTLNVTDNADTSIGQYDSNGNGIEGTGTINDPYRLTITGNWSRDTGVTLDSVDETVKKVHLVVSRNKISFPATWTILLIRFTRIGTRTRISRHPYIYELKI